MYRQRGYVFTYIEYLLLYYHKTRLQIFTELIGNKETLKTYVLILHDLFWNSQGEEFLEKKFLNFANIRQEINQTISLLL